MLKAKRDRMMEQGEHVPGGYVCCRGTCHAGTVLLWGQSDETRSAVLSGFGGQGIILSAVILGRAAVMHDNKFAVQTQVYGPEARGGASMSAVIIDDTPILYPKVADPDIYVIMSQEGFEKYGAHARKDAVMLVDSTLVYSRPNCRYIEIPATREAKQTWGATSWQIS